MLNVAEGVFSKGLLGFGVISVERVNFEIVNQFKKKKTALEDGLRNGRLSLSRVFATRSPTRLQGN